MQHDVVYRDEAAFCAWPFYNGLWKLPDGDIVAAFKRVPADYSQGSNLSHDHLAVQKGGIVTIRSDDNAASWDHESLQTVMDLSTPVDDLLRESEAASAHAAPVDFTDRNVLVLSGALPALNIPESTPWVKVSPDGGRTWRPPVSPRNSGPEALSGVGSCTVRPDGVALLGMTAVTDEGWKRRPLVYGSHDGVNWQFLAYIAPPNMDDGATVGVREGKTPRFGSHRYFYPRPIVLHDGRVIASLRSQRDPLGVMWTEIFESMDGGRTWSFLSRVNDWGAPGDITEMADGRIVCVYGYRLAPYGIRYRCSEDGGRTWGSEIILRDDGGSWDVGYPRVIEIAPGKCLAIYYINLKDGPIQADGGGVRHIAQSIFTVE